ncbi:thiamine transporter 1-like [Engraulis encrasicolus]|uniref:thiamine transporter 1-like n=1 Tax=Engraulis encrasicolus TaxID=184585 RepID=UPI002FD07C8D
MPESWLFPTVLLCLYGFFSNCRPLEPFLTAFLLGPDKNLTETQVINEIYPFWTYSYLVLLIPAFLATDYLRYKPLLILQAGSFIVTYAMIVKVQSVTAMQLLEFFFGLATATDIAYYSYIYSVVDQAHYQKVTGFCRSITLLGSSIGSLLGQVLVSAAQVPLQYLGIITLSFACIAFLTPWFLPMPAKSLFFHHKDLHKQENGSSASPTESEGDSLECKVPLNSEDHGGRDEKRRSGLAEVLRLLWVDFLQSYSSSTLLSWSLWWALSTCGYFQVVNYVQPLWEKILPSKEFQIYNGYVETISTLLGKSNIRMVTF